METFADTSPFHAGVKEKNTKTNQITIAKNQKCIFTLVTYKDFSFYGKLPGLTRSSFATTRNRVANDICVPRNILRDTPDLSYVQPEGNYYFKTSDSYQILKSCSINISVLNLQVLVTLLLALLLAK